MITRVKKQFQVTIPKEARVALGLKVGDLLDAIPQAGGILLLPKILIDRDGHQLDGVLRKDIEEAEADVTAGRVLGPFKSVGAALRAVKRRTHARRTSQ